jgi:transcription initiation factor TFIID subunit 2
LTVEWAVINKTLEAADRARPVPVSDTPNPAVRPVARRVFSTPPPKPASPSSTPSSTVYVKSRKLNTPSATSALPQPIPARAIIKLKVGSQNKVAESSSQNSVKSKKPKNVVDSVSGLLLDAPSGPPPPYVDDGSHDILQEVLAIEREKELRQRAQLDKERSVPNTVIGKRKKDKDVDEDEILRLATPAKKDRATPPSASTSKPQAVSLNPRRRPTAKVKKEKPSESSRSSNVHSPAPSAKGKEKEIAIPDNAKTRKAVPGMPINEKKCKDLLKALIKVPESLIFRQPVDPLRDGCPT